MSENADMDLGRDEADYYWSLRRRVEVDDTALAAAATPLDRLLMFPGLADTQRP